MYPDNLISKTKTLFEQLEAKSWRVSCAESCTGGLIAGLLTEIPGSSNYFGRSFVTYSNRSKIDILGVPKQLVIDHGAVSEEVACAMAENVLNMTTASLTIAVSGIAGPGGVPGKPVGTVHMATATDDGVAHVKQNFGDLGRANVRMATVEAAIDMLSARLQA
ncbi:MAG: CinA family protein [Parvibaculales bacterium]